MSTKASIAWAEEFHLYQEALDNENVYLELRGPDLEFEAGPASVMLRIPGWIWLVLAAVGEKPVDLRFAGWTDEQIRTYVEDQVDDGISDLRRATEEGNDSGILRFAGMLTFGSADDPREDQLVRGIEQITELRDHQTQTRDRARKSIESMGGFGPRFMLINIRTGETTDLSGPEPNWQNRYMALLSAARAALPQHVANPSGLHAPNCLCADCNLARLLSAPYAGSEDNPPRQK